MKKQLTFLALSLFFICSVGGEEPFPSADSLLGGIFVLPEGVRAYQFSSYDKTGGNDDGNRKYAYTDYSRDDRVFTIFRETGAGRLNRIWMTGWRNPGRLTFTGSDDSILLERDVDQIFTPSGMAYSGDENSSSGGFFYYPRLEFSDGLVVTTGQVSSYIQWGYYLYDSPEASPWGKAAIPIIRNDSDFLETGVSAAPGNKELIFRTGSGGIITDLEIKLPYSPDISLEDLILHIDADGGKGAAVLPLSGLFASLEGEAVDSAPVKVSRENGVLSLLSRWPLLWRSGIEISLENRSPSGKDLEISIIYVRDEQVGQGLASGKFGYFQSESTSRVFRGSEPEDYNAASITGRGVLAGVFLVAESDNPDDRKILEGDERIFIDGAMTPQIHGTGTEDFFNGGWYYKNGTFSLLYHGNPYHGVTGAGDVTTQYRWLLPDPVPFYNSAVVNFEHGEVNNKGGRIESSLIWYGHRSEGILEKTGFVGSDDLESSGSPDFLREKLVSGPLQGVAPQRTGDWHLSSTSEEHFFSLPAGGEAGGLLLRRLYDYSVNNQEARVLVNGEFCGTWYTPGFSPKPSIAQNEFMIPPGILKQNGENRITIKPVSSDWTFDGYTVYSLNY
ncbi:MAG: DUF2961 domain-containing protein [Spirochaetales bacterium]|nr:DUF2961 domain-containing protein [Spirochaetales bacterium]